MQRLKIEYDETNKDMGMTVLNVIDKNDCCINTFVDNNARDLFNILINVNVDNMLMSREEYQNGFNNGVKQGRIEKTKECVKFFDDFAVLLNKMRFISSSKESSEYAIGYNNCIDEILELIKS